MERELYDHFSRIGRALGSAPRLEILDLLSQGEKTVERLAAEARLGIKNASAHLRTLREAGLVEARRESPYMYYRLADLSVLRLVRALQELAEDRLAEVGRLSRSYPGAPDRWAPVGAGELARLVESGAVTIVDVRPFDEYQAGHIPGAISIPVEELEGRLAELPRDREVIAYCRGPYCIFASEAVALLDRHGFRARRTPLGVPDWRLAGHPVATGGAA